jgi:hypothetical protein
MLYQGKLVADVLSFSGLLINGMIAFVFPILLCYIVFVAKYRKGEAFEHDDDEENGIAMQQLSPKPTASRIGSYHGDSNSRTNGNMIVSSYKRNLDGDNDVNESGERTEALPPSLLPFRSIIIVGILITFISMITITIVFSIGLYFY